MAWKKGTKLIFSKEGLDSFPTMKNKKAIFCGRAILREDREFEKIDGPHEGLIYVSRYVNREKVTQLWHKDYWRRAIE